MFGVAANGWIGNLHRTVLGYATDMSISSLLDGTNAQRSSSNETAFAINSELNQAAQAKANDMAARDYWSHNTPDGQTPWTFITAAGYDYQTAGENLAYGFATAADTLTAWMNSPEHRANVLNTTYKDVGFGIANTPDYSYTDTSGNKVDAGPETIVVAMYASPAPIAVAAATPTTQPNVQASQSAVQPTAQPAPVVPQQSPASNTPQPSDTKPTTPVTAEPESQPIERIQLISAQASWTVLMVGLLGVIAIVISAVRHGMAWRRVLLRGERFALHHPLVDMATASVIALSLVLTHTVGLIR